MEIAVKLLATFSFLLAGFCVIGSVYKSEITSDESAFFGWVALILLLGFTSSFISIIWLW